MGSAAHDDELENEKEEELDRGSDGSEEDNQRQEAPAVSIYDHNRNLNLDEELYGNKQELSEIDPNRDASGNGDATVVANGIKPLASRASNASPVLSLAASDGLASGCSGSTDTNPTTCSTQRLSSQNSLAQRTEEERHRDNDQPTSNSTNNNDTHHHHHHHHHHHRIAFSDEIAGDSDSDRIRNETNEIELVEGDDELRPATEESIMIRMSHDDDNVNRIIHRRFDEDSQDLVKHFGRRCSALPQLFGVGSYRKNKSALPMHEQLNLHHPQHHLHHHRMCRSHSLHGNAISASIPMPPEPQVPTTVAGVGGTITTVTGRGHRKTAPLPRLVGKNGTVNLFLDNIDRSQYVRDLFTTMIDIKWRYNLMAAAFGFVFSWLFFACIWYMVLYVHNDLVHENDPNWSPCIVNVNTFSAALLFSIETQSTLGFGSRIISVECPGAIVIFCVQLIFGVVIECLIVGMVFAKLSRPAKRSQTIMYSKYATVCLREGKMCLTFRVGDVRSKSHIIGATIRASLVSQKVTDEGEQIPFYHHQLDVKIDDSRNSLLLIWPLTIVHVIDETSPFYELDSDQLANFKFEIITVLEGTVESTGQSIQVRSSYLPSEVKWGYRFEPIVSAHGCGRYAQTIIDYSKFNRILAVNTPQCSAQDYYKQKALSAPIV